MASPSSPVLRLSRNGDREDGGENNSVSFSASSLLIAAASSLLTLACCGAYHAVATRRLRARADELRAAERRGRIRAEVRLRNASKKAAAFSSSSSSSDATVFPLTRVGVVRSPFPRRAGTPRQGALAPDVRAYVELSDVAPEYAEGLEEYSHGWILFRFHANTDLGQSVSRKTKVRPPRAPRKVGALATRSPHRPNPIGLSMVRIDRVERVSGRARVWVSGVDLVDGTPVHDLKPCVPWDAPPPASLRVPDWVAAEDALRRVDLADEADAALTRALDDGVLRPFYASSSSDRDAARRAIAQVLAQDPRATHRRGTPSRDDANDDVDGGGGRGEPYRVLFHRVRVDFVVSDDRAVEVVDVAPANELLDDPDTIRVDGVPIADQAAVRGLNDDGNDDVVTGSVVRDE